MMFEWCVTVACPVRPVDDVGGKQPFAEPRRRLYVWTEHHSAVDAYDEALRVLEGWPPGSRPVDVTPQGMFVPVHAATEVPAVSARRAPAHA